MEGQNPVVAIHDPHTTAGYSLNRTGFSKVLKKKKKKKEAIKNLSSRI